MNESSSHDEKTLGEELFLVHLSRFNKKEPSEDDFDHDYPVPRKRTMSAGDELWQVHLKRSTGTEVDNDEEETDANKRLKVNEKKTQAPTRKRSTRVISLRNRKVKVPLPAH